MKSAEGAARSDLDEKIPLVWRGESGIKYFRDKEKPDLRRLGSREFRLNTSLVLDVIRSAGWMRFSHYGEDIGGVIRSDDLDFLINIGNCASVDGLIEALVSWRRCGPTSPLVGELNALKNEATSGGQVKYLRRIGDFEHCDPAPHRDGSARMVEFGDAIIPLGQLTIAGSADTGLLISGFLNRADLDARFVLELPNGQKIEDFREDGAALEVKRTPLASPISLLDVRVRQL